VDDNWQHAAAIDSLAEKTSVKRQEPYILYFDHEDDDGEDEERTWYSGLDENKMKLSTHADAAFMTESHLPSFADGLGRATPAHIMYQDATELYPRRNLNLSRFHSDPIPWHLSPFL
jgi:hypothetical protein